MCQCCSWNAGTSHSPVKSKARRDVGNGLDNGKSADQFHQSEGGCSLECQRCINAAAGIQGQITHLLEARREETLATG